MSYNEYFQRREKKTLDRFIEEAEKLLCHLHDNSCQMAGDFFSNYREELLEKEKAKPDYIKEQIESLQRAIQGGHLHAQYSLDQAYRVFFDTDHSYYHWIHPLIEQGQESYLYQKQEQLLTSLDEVATSLSFMQRGLDCIPDSDQELVYVDRLDQGGTVTIETVTKMKERCIAHLQLFRKKVEEAKIVISPLQMQGIRPSLVALTAVYLDFVSTYSQMEQEMPDKRGHAIDLALDIIEYRMATFTFYMEPTTFAQDYRLMLHETIIPS